MKTRHFTFIFFLLYREHWLSQEQRGTSALVIRGWGPTLQSGDSGSIPAWGTKTPHAVEQLRPCTTTKVREPQSPRAATRGPSWHSEDAARCSCDPTQPKLVTSKLKRKDFYSQPLTCFFTLLGFKESAQRPSPPWESQYVPTRDTPLQFPQRLQST